MENIKANNMKFDYVAAEKEKALQNSDIKKERP